MHDPSLHLLPQLFLWVCRGEKIAKWRFFFQRHHPIYHIIPATTDSPRGQPALQTQAYIIPAQAAFPVFVKGRWVPTQCRAERQTWVSAWCRMGDGTEGPFVSLILVLALVLAKSFPSSEGFCLIQPQLPK